MTTAGQDSADLAEALRKEGLERTPEELIDLIRGVVAAPESRDPDAWMCLLAPSISSDLTARLRTLKTEIAARGDGGLAAGRSASRERLDRLRAELKRRGLGGFVVPRSDVHQGEAVPPHARRLTWLTGFTGSAGLAVVLSQRAAIFVDGRYTIQVKGEVDADAFEPRHLTEQPPDDWIAEHLGAQDLGYDPWLHTVEGTEFLQAAAERAGGRLVAVDGNPVDAIWRDRPAEPIAPVVAHPLAYAGRAESEKRAEVAQAITGTGADAAVLTLPDSIAWLLNVRGGDVPNTPLVLSFAVIDREGRVDWFVDPRKLASGLGDLLGDAVHVRPPEEFTAALDRLGAEGRTVLVDGASAPVAVHRCLEAAGARVKSAADPCQRPKACKNETELAGSRAAHRRDGAAVTRFLAWLSREAPARARSGEPVTEIEAAEALATLRRGDELFRDLAFETISAAGAHGALPHYRVSETSNRPLLEGELYLVDSGGQYLDGTTDITRVLPVGAPTAEMCGHYTRVLRGHIAIARLRFPKGTTGSQIDAFARAPLWEVGLDYDHGTGHGVGSYLGVHEGPQRLSKLPNRIALEPGMICSNEPGYYREGAYGIRIENLVAVQRAEDGPADEREMLNFETLTLAPFCRALIEPALLDQDELAWVEAYHARVREALLPLLDDVTAAWHDAEPAPLPR